MTEPDRQAVALAIALTVLAAACTITTPTASRRPAIPDLERPAPGGDDDPNARDRWYWDQRAYPTGTIPVRVHHEAIRRELAQTREAAAIETTWDNLGPDPVRDIEYGFTRQNASGRALTVAIHPNDPNTILLGTAQGGIWKSTDHGATFHSTHEEMMPSLAINVIRYHPTDPNVVYAGTGEPNASTSVYGAGLLRSDDGGETWQALPIRGDGWDFDYAAITGLHFDARHPSTMYVSTATVMSAVSYAIFRTPPDQPQTGVFRSTDGGQSWSLLLPATRYDINSSPAPSVGFLDFEYGGAAAPELMIVSEMYGGLLKSENAGASWTRITPVKPGGLGVLPADVTEVSLYDGSTGKYRLFNRLPNPDYLQDFRRVEIGMSPANPSILYAGVDANSLRLDLNGNGIYEPNKDRTVARSLLFKSEDGGATWRWLGSQESGIPDYCAGQCGYDNVVTVDPEDPNDVFIAGSADYTGIEPDPVDPDHLVELPWHGMVYRSRDGGSTWLDLTPHCTRVGTAPNRFLAGVPVFPCVAASTSNVIHPDTHAIVFGPQGEIYVCNDGGIYRGTLPTSTSGRRRSVRTGPAPGPLLAGSSYTWENLNDGLSTLQFYRVASHPTDPNIILGGMQDNSCGYWNGQAWEGWGGGDGTVAAFDSEDPRHVYLGYQFGVARNDDGGAKDLNDGWVDILYEPFQNAGESSSFVPVFTLDPVQPSIVYAASTAGLFRSFNRGDTFLRLLPGQRTDGAMTTISVSPVDHRIVWAATNTGVIYRYVIQPNGTALAADVTHDLPDRWISGIAASYASASTVYAVFNGYDANTPSRPGKVFVSDDDGATWTNISGNLPDVPATAIALDPSDPDRIWIATDIAVFSTSNRGTTWTSERRNMPIVGVQDLDFNPNTGYLLAATHGRGIWRLAVGAAGGD